MNDSHSGLEARLQKAADRSGFDVAMVTLIYQSIPRSDHAKLVLPGKHSREILQPIVRSLRENNVANSLPYDPATHWPELKYSGIARIVQALVIERLVICDTNAFAKLPTSFEFTVDACALDAPVEIKWSVSSMLIWLTCSAVVLAGFIRTGFAGITHTIGAAVLIYFGSVIFLSSRADPEQSNKFGMIYAGFMIAVGIILFWYVITDRYFAVTF